MKIKMCIFGKIVSVIAMGAVLGGVYVAHPAYAVIDRTGCDNENNLYINPDLALCSTHVYNIGKITNPENSAERQLMQDVVALKTTLITQQMYSQYEILATTVKRLKTQLEKEVLLARLKSVSAAANGGTTSDSSSASNDKYIVLSNAENCLNFSGNSESGLQCLLRNLDKVVSAVASGDVGNARRQLQKDLETANMYSVTVVNPDDTSKTVLASTGITECKNLSAKRDVVSTCARKLQIAINDRLGVIKRQNTPQRTPGYY